MQRSKNCKLESMPKLDWLESAEAGLDKTADYIAQDNVAAAIDVYLKVKESSKGLLDNPDIGRKGRVNGTRERIVTGTKSIIIYRVTDKIEIIRVLHGTQHV